MSNKEARHPTTLEAPASPDGLRVRADMVEGKLNDSGSCAAHLRSAADEIERLRSAIRWALGEGGSDFGNHRPEGDAPRYWWRNELRRRAGL